MTKEKKDMLTDIVLFHGSLDELNNFIGENTDRQFSYHMDLFCAEKISCDAGLEVPINALKEKIKKRNYHGLVNVRTSFFRESSGVTNHYLFEGTPITDTEEENQ